MIEKRWVFRYDGQREKGEAPGATGLPNIAMKIIHLSDLHIGKRVNEFSMLEDQEYILRDILGIVDTEKPQAVIIAGDTCRLFLAYLRL